MANLGPLIITNFRKLHSAKRARSDSPKNASFQARGLGQRSAPGSDTRFSEGRLMTREFERPSALELRFSEPSGSIVLIGATGAPKYKMVGSIVRCMRRI